MPKVPVYEQQVQEQSAPAQLMNVKTSVENFGGGTANILKTVEKATTSAYDIYQKEKTKADKARVNESESALIEFENSLLHDPSKGALNTRGKNSFGVLDSALSDYDKKSSEIMSGLANDEQKAAFEEKARNRKLSIDRQLQGHVSQEIIRYDTEITTNFVKNHTDSAINNWKDENLVGESVKAQEQALIEFGKKYGMSDEEIAQKVNDAKTNTHKSVINAMLENDQDIQAQEYFKKNESQFFGDDKIRIQKAVEDGSTRRMSQEFVNDVLSKGTSQSEAIKRASQIENPKLRDETLQRVKTEFALRDSAERDDLEKIHTNNLNLIDQGNVKDLTKLPGWSRFDDNQREAIKRYALNKAEGKSVVTDPNVYFDLRELAANPKTQDKFLKTNLRDYINDISKPDLDKLISKQESLRKGDGKAQNELKSYRSNSDTIKGLYTSAGFDTSDKEKYAKFQNTVEQAQIDLQEKLGRQLNKQELIDVAKDLVTKKTIERKFWFDKEVAPFEIEDVEDFKKIQYKEIPDKKRIEIEASLKKAGKPTSQETVRNIYIQSLMRGR